MFKTILLAVILFTVAACAPEVWAPNYYHHDPYFHHHGYNDWDLPGPFRR